MAEANRDVSQVLGIPDGKRPRLGNEVVLVTTPGTYFVEGSI